MLAAVSQPLSSSARPAEAGRARGRTRPDDMASLRGAGGATFLLVREKVKATSSQPPAPRGATRNYTLSTMPRGTRQAMRAGHSQNLSQHAGCMARAVNQCWRAEVERCNPPRLLLRAATQREWVAGPIDCRHSCGRHACCAGRWRHAGDRA
eukprot:1109261-Prymnesium_polylepis.2